jgi:hypothetical protein
MKSKQKFRKILQRFSLLAALFFMTASWSGCEKDYNYVPPPATGTMSLSADIQPIFTANCSLGGCHDGNNYDPDLRDGFSHTSMFNLPGCIDTLDAESSDLYVRINAQAGDPGFMPDGGNRLTQTDINKVLLWIQQGARDN